MPTEYNAQILTLDLPAQEPDNPGFLALYTVARANPPADPSRANVVRTGVLGRERLGTPAETGSKKVCAGMS